MLLSNLRLEKQQFVANGVCPEPQPQTHVFAFKNTLNQANLSKFSRTQKSKHMAPFLWCFLFDIFFTPQQNNLFLELMSPFFVFWDQVAATKPNSVQ